MVKTRRDRRDETKTPIPETNIRSPSTPPPAILLTSSERTFCRTWTALTFMLDSGPHLVGFHQLIIKQFVRLQRHPVCADNDIKSAFCSPACFEGTKRRRRQLEWFLFRSLYVLDVTKKGLRRGFNNFLWQLIIKSYDCVWRLPENR